MTPTGASPNLHRPKPGRAGAAVRFAAGLCLAALLAACGASPPSTKARASAAAPANLAPGTFEVTLAPGWRHVSINGSYGTLVTEISGQNPLVGQSLAAQLAHVSARTVYYAFDASSATVSAGALVTLNIVRVTLPAGVDLVAFSRGVRGEIEQLVEQTVAPITLMTESGPADRYVYQAPFTDANGQPRVAPVTQYVVVVPGYGYELTFATTASRSTTDAPVFDSIARSFRAAP